ncbi:PAN domain-containing protein [Woodsholea maritima]|uniref:PAN domain-containing protein n=1 Tax=Woodsholea maritima TaxID=240237 RepID=UPI00037896E0|nr:PAN domain-containing protein [Woodsholea maritima]
MTGLIFSALLAVSLVQDVGFERRGAFVGVYDDARAQSPFHCAEACAENPSCQAWTWRQPRPDRAARCELLRHAHAPSPAPDAVSGLAPEIRARIETGLSREPSVREDQYIDEILRDRH